MRDNGTGKRQPQIRPGGGVSRAARTGRRDCTQGGRPPSRRKPRLAGSGSENCNPGSADFSRTALTIYISVRHNRFQALALSTRTVAQRSVVPRRCVNNREEASC